MKRENESPLEAEVRELREQLDVIAERVRIGAVADAFLRNEHTIREGDYFLLDKSRATKLYSVESSTGKWTYVGHDGRTIEPFKVPDQADHERLYTIAEVAEVCAKLCEKIITDAEKP